MYVIWIWCDNLLGWFSWWNIWEVFKTLLGLIFVENSSTHYVVDYNDPIGESLWINQCTGIGELNTDQLLSSLICLYLHKNGARGVAVLPCMANVWRRSVCHIDVCDRYPWVSAGYISQLGAKPLFLLQQARREPAELLKPVVEWWRYLHCPIFSPCK